MFQTFNKVLNEFNGIYLFLGLFLYLSLPFKRKTYSIVAIICFMLLWRIFIIPKEIVSSRYFAFLIFPFTLIFSECYIKRNQNNKLITTIFLCILFIIFLLDDFRISRNSQAFDNAIDLVRHEKKHDSKLKTIVNNKEVGRFRYYIQSNDIAGDSLVNQAIYNFSEQYFPNTLIIEKGINTLITEKERSNGIIKKHIGHILEKTKAIDFIKHESKSQIAKKSLYPKERESLIRNGEFDEIDSPLDSFNKCKRYIRNFSSYFSVDTTPLTPKNTYYQTWMDLNNNPKFTAVNQIPICDKKGVYFNIEKGFVYFQIAERFNNGNYILTSDVYGKKNSTFRIIYSTRKGTIWTKDEVAIFTFPETGFYSIRTLFNVSKLSKEDFFQLGFHVQEGELYIDNIFLDYE